MSEAAETATTGQDFSRRPWAEDARRREPTDGQYAEYEAWADWFNANLDDQLPDGEGSILDALTVTQSAYLFNVMGRLADGWVAPSKGSEVAGG